MKIPSDLIEKAKIPKDIQIIIDQGGYAVYAELYQGKVRAKFFGRFTDGDVKRALNSLRRRNLQVDRIVEENGNLREIDNRPPIV